MKSIDLILGNLHLFFMIRIVAGPESVFFGAAHMPAKLSLISLLLIADQCSNRWFAEKKKRIYIDNILQICYILHVNILPVRAAERGIAE